MHSYKTTISSHRRSRILLSTCPEKSLRPCQAPSSCATLPPHPWLFYSPKHTISDQTRQAILSRSRDGRKSAAIIGRSFSGRRYQCGEAAQDLLDCPDTLGGEAGACTSASTTGAEDAQLYLPFGGKASQQHQTGKWLEAWSMDRKET